MIWYFIKFFECEKWADQFMAGHLYLNTLGYFKKIEPAGSADRGGLDGSGCNVAATA